MPLPEVTQVFLISAQEYLAGIDSMIDINVDLMESIDEVIALTRDMGAEMAASMSAGLSGAAEAAAAADERLAAATEQANEALAEQTEILRGVQAELEIQTEMADSAVMAIREQTVAVDELTTALREQAAADVDASGANDAEGASAKGAAGGIGMMKTALLGIGIAAVYGIDKAMEFQSSMEQLHTQAGVAQSQIGGLSQSVLELAGQVGESPGSLSESLYHVASNLESVGATGPEMLNAVKVAAEGAQIGNANLVDVTNALGGAIASGIKGVQNYSQAMGFMNATVGAGDMTMQNLAEAFSTGVLANMKLYGVSLQDVSAALATFGDNNIRGTKAGTDLRMAVQAMVMPVTTAGAQLKALGLNTKSFANELKSGGLDGALQLLVTRMKATGVSSKDVGEVITNLFGKRAGAGIGVLIGEFSRFQGKYKAVQEGADSFAADWAARQQTMQQQWHDLVSASQALAVSFGSVLLPAATKVVGILAKFGVFLENNGWLAAFAGGILAIVVALKVFATVETMLRGVAAGMALIGQAAAADVPEVTALDAAMDANVLAIVLIAILALVIGLYELYKHFKIVRDAVADVGHAFEALPGILVAVGHAIESAWDAVWSALKGAVTAGIDWIKSHWKLLAGIILGVLFPFAAVFAGIAALVIHFWSPIWRTLAAPVVRAFADVGAAIAKAWSKIWANLIAPVIRAFDRVKNAITTGFDGWWKSHGAELEEAWAVIWSKITAIFDGFITTIVAVARAGWALLLNVVVPVFDAIETDTRAVWTILAGLFRVGIAVIVGDARMGWNLLTAIVRTVWNVLVAIVKPGIKLVENLLSSAWATLVVITRAAWEIISTVVKVAWDLIGGIVKIAVSAIVAVIKAAWDIIVGVFSVALDLMTGHWSQAWHDLLAMCTQVANAIMAFLSSAWHDVVSAAVSAWHALVSGVSSLVSTLISYMSRLPGEILSALGDLGSLLIGAGRALIEGLINGVEGAVGGLLSTIGHIASEVGGAFKKVLGIFSPSKVFETFGLQIAQGLIKGLEGSASQVKAAAAKMATDVKDAYTDKYMSYATASYYTKFIESDNARLQKLATQRTALESTITTADKYAASVTSSAVSFAGLSNLSSTQTTTSAGIAGGLAANLAQLQQFSKDLKALGKLGLNKTILDQIVQAGPVQGDQMAQALLSGPRSYIGQINKTQTAINSAATQLGQSAADAMYDSGKDAGKGFLSGLEGQVSAINAMMTKVAKNMVATIKHELQIHSPSAVMAEVGGYVAEGLAQGIEGGQSRVGSAMASLAGVLSAPGAGAAGSGGTTINVEVNVPAGFIGSEQQLVQAFYLAIQKGVLQNAKRNGSNGLVLAR